VALSDGEIVARVVGGDLEAFSLLFQRYGRLVHALALAKTTRKAAAAEVTRKVFTRAYGELERMPPEAGFRPFLLSLLQQEAASHVKDHGRSLQMLRVGGAEAKKAGASLELRWIFRSLKGEDAAFVLLEVADRLPPNYVAPFLLRHLEGMAPAEIAEATGLGVAEVRTALDGARRLFERELKRCVEGAA
jgi:RNA polymerase sigma-70 factor (ECF subfamily)